MDFEIEEKVKFGRELVFTTIRDKLAELVPYLPNVKKIEVLERKKTKGVIQLTNKWYADYKIPALVRKVIKVDELSWTDYAKWYDDDYTCEWRIEPVVFKDYVKAEGKNFFIEKGDETIVKLTGHIEIDVSSHPLVPRLLAGTVNKEITGIVLMGIKPNLVSLIEGLRKYLSKKKTK